MRKPIVLMLFMGMLSIQSASSQFEKGKFYVDGYFSHYHNDKVVANKETSEIRSSITPTVGYFVAKNFVVGVGLNYKHWGNTEREEGGKAYILDIHGNQTLYSSWFNSYVQNRNTYLPAVFIKYIYPITKRLSVSIMVKSFTGKLYQENYKEQEDVIQDKTTTSGTQKIDGNYTGVIISPELRYLVTKKIGIQLNLDGYNALSSPQRAAGTYIYGMPETNSTKMEQKKSSGFYFAPSYWSFGAFVLL